MKKIAVGTCYFLFLIIWFVQQAHAASGPCSRVKLNPYAKDFDPTTCERFGIVLDVSSSSHGPFTPDFVKHALAVYDAYNVRVKDNSTVVGLLQSSKNKFLKRKLIIACGLKLMNVKRATYYLYKTSNHTFVWVGQQIFNDDSLSVKEAQLHEDYFFEK